jgi:hypothetical protein
MKALRNGVLGLFSFFLAGIALALAPLCQGQTWPFETPTDMKKVEAPIYEKFNPVPVAVLCAERIFGDYQTRGVFRIGALPLSVAEDLSIELKDALRLPAALNALGVRFAPEGGGGRGIEGRNFRLAFSGEKQGSLRARTVRLDRAAEWTMEDGLLNVPNSAPVRFQRGTVTLQGPEAGTIKCQTTNGVFQVHVIALKTD